MKKVKYITNKRTLERALKKTPVKIADGLQALSVPIDALTPDPNNANDHTPENLKVIADSIDKMGQVKPVVALENGVIKAGNGTWLVLKEKGATHIAVVLIPKELEEHADDFAIQDNQATRLSRWNPDNLKKMIEKIKSRGGSTTRLGFSDAALREIMDKAKKKRRPSGWDEDTDPKAPRCKVGDLWKLGEHRLLVGDSTDQQSIARLMDGRQAQLVHTDPPYGVDYQDTRGQKIKGDKAKHSKLIKLVQKAMEAAAKHSTEDAAFYIWHASGTRDEFSHAIKSAGLQEIQYLIWAKPGFVLGRADYHWNYEPCFYASKDGQRPAFFGGRSQTTLWRISALAQGEETASLGRGVVVSDGESDLMISKPTASKKVRRFTVDKGKSLRLSTDGQGAVWEIGKDSNDYIHPNQKPVELARRAIENSTKPGQAVLDPFAGSGTTLAACEETGRDAFIVELDPKYAARIIGRWEKMTQKKAERE